MWRQGNAYEDFSNFSAIASSFAVMLMNRLSEIGTADNVRIY